MPAQWSMTLPAQPARTDGSVQLVAQVTDSVTGHTGTMVWTLTADGHSTTILDIPGVTDFAAWSTQ